MSISKETKIQKPTKLPSLLDRKIYKTGQTRGADDDVIFQNRVSRTSTVLIPYTSWARCARPTDGTERYENGFIVLIPPEVHFGSPDIDATLATEGLVIGNNALVFYETREQWNLHNPDDRGWKPAKRRARPLGGEYVARVPATTAVRDSKKIARGFTDKSTKGAGIRVYEYASTETITRCRLQLEALFWHCSDAVPVAIKNGMAHSDAAFRREFTLAACDQQGLLDLKKLFTARMLNAECNTICPLCLEPLSASGFFNRMEQAEGRDVPDLTVTQVNLFHIDELRTGLLNHRPYNVGWGHHHCNVVVKDAGIRSTLDWMQNVLNRNIEQGHLPVR